MLGQVEPNGLWMWMTAAQARRVARVKGVEGVMRVEAMEKLSPEQRVRDLGGELVQGPLAPAVLPGE